MVAKDLGIRHTVHVERGAEPSTPAYDYHEITLLSELPPLLGI
jgi:2-haloacid dehalogenase